MSSEHPATIRIDKDEDLTACLSRSQVAGSFPVPPAILNGVFGRHF